ncbi:MAG: Lrp/AsnC ligand binding domain-containing protein [Rhodospirillales bacterium]|jgi:DNA-binding Lrp family transcriptional regulator|nr:Lrp/AsnC ligand binding domain-containing protein [Rhodospirillales bacterium]
MQTIFVQVKCERAAAYRSAAEIVETIDGVSEVYSTSGAFDLLVKCYLADDDDIGRFVTEKLQAIAGVRDTYTIIAFKAFR